MGRDNSNLSWLSAILVLGKKVEKIYSGFIKQGSNSSRPAGMRTCGMYCGKLHVLYTRLFIRHIAGHVSTRIFFLYFNLISSFDCIRDKLQPTDSSIGGEYMGFIFRVLYFVWFSYNCHRSEAKIITPG